MSPYNPTATRPVRLPVAQTAEALELLELEPAPPSLPPPPPPHATSIVASTTLDAPTEIDLVHVMTRTAPSLIEGGFCAHHRISGIIHMDDFVKFNTLGEAYRHCSMTKLWKKQRRQFRKE
jgi:hypothetical protein